MLRFRDKCKLVKVIFYNLIIYCGSGSPDTVAVGRLAADVIKTQGAKGHPVTTSKPHVNNRASILKAGNGTPLVMINKPNRAGVSHNTYDKFNVGTKGMILNNSLRDVKTQLAGWVDGNPLLNGQHAKLILNEVVGSNLSLLQGAIEVAGRRADVILANQNGIVCDGCGFINTSRATLTTGAVSFKPNGWIDSFNVNGGNIIIGQKGLDVKDIERLDLIARGLVVEGSIKANKLNAILGKNRVDYDSLTAKSTGDDGKAQFAVDVKQMGGMYAGQIYIVATDKGFGVNSEGRIVASQGNIVLAANGDIKVKDVGSKGELNVSGHKLDLKNMQAIKDIKLSYSGSATLQNFRSEGSLAIGGIGNLNITGLGEIGGNANLSIIGNYNIKDFKVKGNIATNGVGDTSLWGDLTVHGEANFGATGKWANSGKATFARAKFSNITDFSNTGDIYYLASTDLILNPISFRNSGNIEVANSKFKVNTQNMLLSGRIYGDGLDFNSRVISSNDGDLSSSKNIRLNGIGLDLNNTNLKANEDIAIRGTNITGSGIWQTKDKVSIIGDNLTTSSNIIALDDIAIVMNKKLGLVGANVKTDKKLSIQALEAINKNSKLYAADLDYKVTGRLGNFASQIIASKALQIDSKFLDNVGTLAGETTKITAGRLANLGKISGDDLDLELINLINHGQIIGGDSFVLNARDKVINRLSGVIGSILDNGGITTAALDNAAAIQGITTFDIPSITNSGSIASGERVTIKSKDLNNSGSISGDSIIAKQTKVILNTGDIVGSSLLQLETDSIKNSGNLLSKGELSVSSNNAFVNDSGFIQGDRTLLAGSSLSNQQGKIIGKDLGLTVSSELGNTLGIIRASNKLETHAGSLTNSKGTINGNTNILELSNSLDNQDGAIKGMKLLKINSDKLFNATDGILAGGEEFNLTVNDVINNQGILGSNGDLSILVETLQNQADGKIIGGELLVNSKLLGNKGILKGERAVIEVDGDINNIGTIAGISSLDLTARKLDNSKGKLLSKKTVTAKGSDSIINQHGLVQGASLILKTQNFNNDQGKIFGKDIELTGVNVTNNLGIIKSLDSLILSATNLINTKGAITTGTSSRLSGDLTFNVDNKLDNTKGLIEAGLIHLNAKDFINNAGHTLAEEDLVIDVNGITNTNGRMLSRGSTAITTTTTLSNNLGKILSDGAITIVSPAFNSGTGLVHGKKIAMELDKLINTEHGELIGQQQILVNSKAIDNSGLMLSEGEVNLTTKSFKNVGDIKGYGELQIKSATVNNTKELYGTDINIFGSTSVVNSGSIQAFRNLVINGGALTNENVGNLASGNKLELKIGGTIKNKGAITAKGNAIIQAKHLENVIGAKLISDMSLNASLNGLNNHSLIKGGNVNIVGTGHIYNLNRGIIEGANALKLAGKTITNRSIINGVNTAVISQDSIHNYSSIYGDSIHLQSARMYNQGGAIATRSRTGKLLIGGGEFHNFDNGLVFAMNDLMFGGSFTGGSRSGNLATLVNTSSNIQADGNIGLFVNYATNKKKSFGLKMREITNYSTKSGGDAVWDGKHYYERVTVNETTRIERDEIVVDSDPGVISAGGSIHVGGIQLRNDKSKIAAGKDITFSRSSSVQYVAIGGGGQQITTKGGTKETFTWAKVLRSDFAAFRKRKIVTTTENSNLKTDIKRVPLNLSPASIKANRRISGKSHSIRSLSGAKAKGVKKQTGMSKADVGDRKGDDVVLQSIAPNDENFVAGTDVSSENPKSTKSRELQPIDVKSVLKSAQASATVNNVQRPALQTVQTVDTRLNTALFKAPTGESSYYVETDPRFTNRQRFLSARDRLGGTNGIKYYGDGFAEQRLLSQQILHLTGGRYLSGYDNTEDEYSDLLDHGKDYAAKNNLSIGEELTKEQVESLTEDMVLMVKQQVTTPSGELVTALVPKVYLKPSKLRLTNDGNIIMAKEIDLEVEHDIENQGSILAEDLIKLKARNIVSLGGIIKAHEIDLETELDLGLTGDILATSKIDLKSGRDLFLVSTKQSLTTTVGSDSFTKDILSTKTRLVADDINLSSGRNLHLSAVDVKATRGLSLDSGQDLTMDGFGMKHESFDVIGRQVVKNHNTTRMGTKLTSGNDAIINSSGRVSLVGADIDIGGLGSITGKSIDLEAVKDVTSVEKNSRDNYSYQLDETLSGGKITAVDGLTLRATGGGQGNIRVKGGELASGGTTALLADNDVAIDSMKTRHLSKIRSTEVKRRRFSTTKTTKTTDERFVKAEHTAIHGRDIVIKGGDKGAIKLKGTDLTAINDINLAAKDITLEDAHDEYSLVTEERKEKTGFMSSGWSLSYGKKKKQETLKLDATTHQANDVTSAVGDITISGTGDYTQVGGRFTTAGDIKVSASNVSVTGAKDKLTQEHTVKESFKGTTMGGKSKLLGSASTAKDMLKHVRDRKSNVHKAMAATAGGLNVYNTVDEAIDDPMTLLDSSIGISATFKQQASRQSTSSSTTKSSSMQANNVHIQVTGDNGTLHLKGAKVQALDNVTLESEGKVLLESELDEDKSTSKSSSFEQNYGVGFHGGSNFGLGVSAGLDHAHGKTKRTSQIHQHSEINAGKTLTIKSKGDTTLRGATAKGKKVVADIGGDLTVESVLDEEQEKSRTYREGVNGTVGIPGLSSNIASVGASVSQTDVKARTRSISKQSGLIAGSDGYDIDVNGVTTVKGGLIDTENATASHLKTKAIKVEDIKQESSYSASRKSINVSSDLSKKVTPTPTFIHGSDSKSTITKGMVAGNLELTDEVAQQQLTGESIDEARSNVNSEKSHTTQANIYDEKEVNAGFAIAGAVSQEVNRYFSNKAKKADRLRQQAKDKMAEGKTQEAEDLQRQSDEILDRHGSGGTYRQVATAAIAGLQGNVMGGGASVALGASANLAQQIGSKAIGDEVHSKDSSLKKGSVPHIVSHTALGAVTGAVTGNSLAGAIGAGGGELIATQVVDRISPVDEDTSQSSKDIVRSSISTAIGLGTGASGMNAATVANSSNAAVDNNYLSRQQKISQKKERKEASTVLEKMLVDAKYKAIDVAQDLAAGSGALVAGGVNYVAGVIATKSPVATTAVGVAGLGYAGYDEYNQFKDSGQTFGEYVRKRVGHTYDVAMEEGGMGNSFKMGYTAGNLATGAAAVGKAASGLQRAFGKLAQGGGLQKSLPASQSVGLGSQPQPKLLDGGNTTALGQLTTKSLTNTSVVDISAKSALNKELTRERKLLANLDTAIFTSGEKGVLGERRTWLTMTRAGYEELNGRLPSNNGFDGVWIKKDSFGKMKDIVITESKFASTGKAGLADTRKMGRQMSGDWIEANIKKMARSQDKVLQETAQLLRKHEHLIRKKVAVIDASGIQRFNKVKIPR